MTDGIHEDREIDAAIDRAAKQLVMKEPPKRMYVAVMTDIRAMAGERGTPWRWTSWRWSLAALSAAALVLMGVLVWGALRPQPNQRAASVAVVPPPPAPVHVAKDTPPVEPAPGLSASATPTRSVAVRAVRRTGAEPTAGSAEVEQTQTQTPSLQPFIQPSQQPLIQVDDIDVPAIGVNAIHIDTIPVDIDPVGPIPISAIAVDSK